MRVRGLFKWTDLLSLNIHSKFTMRYWNFFICALFILLFSWWKVLYLMIWSNALLSLSFSVTYRDISGQERFRSSIPSYIRDSSVAVIVYDVSSIRFSFSTFLLIIVLLLEFCSLLYKCGHLLHIIMHCDINNCKYCIRKYIVCHSKKEFFLCKFVWDFYALIDCKLVWMILKCAKYSGLSFS